MIGKEQIKNDIDSPLVSICIPTYNRAEKLERAVRSAQNSTYENIEIIISDNASSDHTEAVSKRLASTDGRILYFRNESNIGAAKNFEHVRSKANGKYFMWLGDDDRICNLYVEKCMAALELDLSLAVASGVAIFMIGEKQHHTTKRIKITNSIAAFRVLRYLLSVTDNSIFYGVFRREHAIDAKLGNFLAGDWAFMADVLDIGKADVVEDARIYRDAEKSTSSSIKSIVESINAPEWHWRYPWIAMACNISKHDWARNNRNTARIVNQAIIFGVLMYRSAWENFKFTMSNIRLAKMIYRKHFKRDRIEQ